MNSEEFSCIKQVVKTVQFSLPFMYVTNDIAGITGALDGWKRQFVKQLNGIVVGYKNVSLTSRIVVASKLKPYSVYNVKASFDLFCPNIGDIVKGKINRISREHIGCLIQDTINVTIHLPKDYPSELSKYIYLNREILFEIANFSSEPKVVRVTGKITPKCIELMNILFPPCQNSVSEKENSSSDEETMQVNLSILNSIKALPKSDEDVKPKKLKKRKRESESATMESVEESPTRNIPEENNMSPKKKKIKNLDSSPTDFTENSSKKSKINLNSIPTDSPKKSPKEKKSKIILDSNVSDSSEKSHKKKKKELKTNLDLNSTNSPRKSPKKKKTKIDLDSSLTGSILMSPKKELERKDSTDPIAVHPIATDSEASNDVEDMFSEVQQRLVAIKKEITSPPIPFSSSSFPEENKKKRKRESTLKGEGEDPRKKKKRKKKNKDGLESAKSKDKKKSSKKKAKVAASGTVLKKDKKSSKDKKPSKKEKGAKSKTSKKSKKDHKTDKSKKKNNKKIKLDPDFETKKVKKIKSESE